MGTTDTTIKVGKQSFTFCFNFEALREMDDERGYNCFQEASDLATGESKPSLVGEILEVGITHINGKEISPGEHSKAAEQFIDRAGFQEAHTVAQKLLAFVLVGDEKKSKLKTLESVINELRNYNASPFTTFTNQLFLWIYRIGIFGLWVWLIFSPYGLHSLLKMD